MEPPASLLPHRNVPTTDEIMRHQWREVIETSQPNSISANSLAFPDFLESTSTWNQRHIIAFRMLDFNDLPLHYLYPQTYYPTADDPVIVKVEQLFILSQDEIRQGNFDMVQTGAAFSFYQAIQDCLRTQQKTPSPPQVPTRPQRVSQPQSPVHQYNLSSSSGSSFLPSISSVHVISVNPTNEDKTEAVTNILVITYLYLLAALENTTKEASSRKKVLFRYVHPVIALINSLSAHHDHFVVMVEGKACGSENDGSGWRSRWSQSGGQWVKSGQIPLCSIEVPNGSRSL